MQESSAHLILKIDTDQPIELGAFVGAFTSIGNELERFVGQRYPDVKGSAEFYVKEVRSGCVEAEIFAMLSGGMMFALSAADTAMMVEDFVRRWGSRITSFIERNRDAQPDTKAEVKDYLDAVKVIANDPNGSASLSAAVYEDGKRDIRIGFQFTNKEAAAALAEIEKRRADDSQPENSDHERVLMVFTRSDVRDATVGKGTGERVIIEEISKRPLALMYASSLAADRIKHEIREADDNLYKKGFVVDVNVRTVGGKPVAYAVTQFHEVFTFPEDGE